MLNVTQVGVEWNVHNGHFTNEGTKAMIVADEIYWNPKSATGDELVGLIAEAHTLGYKAGLVVSPAAWFDVKLESITDWTKPWELKSAEGQAEVEAKILADMAKADFVAIDPYAGVLPGVSNEWILQFTKNLEGVIKGMGKEAYLVVQGFSKAGQEVETTAYVMDQLAATNFDEVIVFGKEDGADLAGPEWTALDVEAMLIGIPTP